MKPVVSSPNSPNTSLKSCVTVRHPYENNNLYNNVIQAVRGRGHPCLNSSLLSLNSTTCTPLSSCTSVSHIKEVEEDHAGPDTYDTVGRANTNSTRVVWRGRLISPSTTSTNGSTWSFSPASQKKVVDEDSEGTTQSEITTVDGMWQGKRKVKNKLRTFVSGNSPRAIKPPRHDKSKDSISPSSRKKKRSGIDASNNLKLKEACTSRNKGRSSNTEQKRKERAKASESKPPNILKQRTHKSSKKNATVLLDWTIKPVPDCRGVCVEGQKPGMEDFWHSTAVADVKKPKLITTISGSQYKLSGKMNKLCTLDNGFTKEIAAAFSSGFPKHWRELIKEFYCNLEKSIPADIEVPPPVGKRWIKLQKKNSTPTSKKTLDEEECSIASTSIMSASGLIKRECRVEDIVVTKSGRRSLPPLARWAGQTYALVPNTNTVQVSFLTDTAEKALSKETKNVLRLPKTFQKLACHKSFYKHLTSPVISTSRQRIVSMPKISRSSLNSGKTLDPSAHTPKISSKKGGEALSSVKLPRSYSSASPNKQKKKVTQRNKKSPKLVVEISNCLSSHKPVEVDEMCNYQQTSNSTWTKKDVSSSSFVDSNGSNYRPSGMSGVQLRSGKKLTVAVDRKNELTSLKHSSSLSFVDVSDLGSVSIKAVDSTHSNLKHDEKKPLKSNVHPEIKSTSSKKDKSKSKVQEDFSVANHGSAGISSMQLRSGKKTVVPVAQKVCQQLCPLQSRDVKTHNGSPSSENFTEICDENDLERTKPQRKKRSRLALSTSKGDTNEDQVIEGRPSKRRKLKDAPKENEQSWTSEETDRFHRALREVNSADDQYWHHVSQLVGGRSETECQEFHLQFLDSKSKKTGSPVCKKSKGKKLKREKGQPIRGGKNTLRRKNDLRNFLKEQNEDYDDNLFDGTPYASRKPVTLAANINFNLSDSKIFGSNHNFFTPSTGVNTTRTPGTHYRAKIASAMKTPAFASAVASTPLSGNQHVADRYVKNFIERRKRWDSVRARSQDMTDSVLPIKSIFTQDLNPEILMDGSEDKVNHDEDESQYTYYWDDEF